MHPFLARAALILAGGLLAAGLFYLLRPGLGEAVATPVAVGTALFLTGVVEWRWVDRRTSVWFISLGRGLAGAAGVMLGRLWFG